MYRLSRHARKRLSERAITTRAFTLHMAYADRALPVGKGCESLCCSRVAVRQMLVDGATPQDADRARRLVTVVASDGEVITLFVMRAGCRRARRYWRQ